MAITLHQEYAYTPTQGANSRGRKHLVTEDDFEFGRLRRKDTLAATELRGAGGGESTVGSTKMQVVRGRRLIGQVAHTAVPTPHVKFASIVATG